MNKTAVMHKIYINITATFIVLFTITGVNGQNNTMYYMGTVPQSYYLNPATQPRCGFFIGMPVFSSFYANFQNTGFGSSDIIFNDPESDSVIHLLHPNANKEAFLNGLKDVEQLSLSTATNLASFGFRIGDVFIGFDATVKLEEKLRYPKDLLEFMLQGSENRNVIDLKNLNIDFLNYAEFALTISKNYGDNLSLGIRPKFLAGISTIYNDNKDLNIETSVDAYDLNINSEVKMSLIGATIPVDENGAFDPKGDFILNDSTLSSGGYGKFLKNKGFGIDLGVHFNPIEKLQLSASVLDLGYINWKESTNITSFEGSFEWEGVYFDGDSAILDNSILDSLKESISVSGNNLSFSRALSPKIIFGGRFFLSEGFNLGLLSKTSFNKNKTIQEIVFLANLQPVKGFSLSGSYSISGNSRNVFGLGLGLKAGPLNLYTIMDYIPLKYNVIPVGTEIPVFGGAPYPLDYNEVNIRIGLNLIFGCRKAKKLSQDKPLFNSSEWMF